MDNKYLNEVLDRLENYQKMMRQIELLQYEIQYASHVTPTEMIEVMTFQKRDADNAGTNAYPKSVPEIAMSPRLRNIGRTSFENVKQRLGIHHSSHFQRLETVACRKTSAFPVFAGVLL